MALLVVLAAACGSDDGSTDPVPADSVAAPATGDSEPPAEPAGGGDSDVASPSDVAACLADAGFETTSNEELLTEQQRADVATLFGQVDGLTFTGVPFAGGISFFTTSEQATERLGQLSEVALELVPVGPTLISIEAGTGYEDAVAAAEACLA